jgi:hypothetical protein
MTVMPKTFAMGNQRRQPEERIIARWMVSKSLRTIIAWSVN